MHARDTLDWIVDVGAAIGGFASLLAVVVALIALRDARQLRRAAQIERKRQTVARGIERLEDVGMEVARLGTALDNTSFTTSVLHWRQLRVLLAVGHLEAELPEVTRIANGMIEGEGGRMRKLSIEVIERALPEVVNAINIRRRELEDLGHPDY